MSRAWRDRVAFTLAAVIIVALVLGKVGFDGYVAKAEYADSLAAVHTALADELRAESQGLRNRVAMLSAEYSADSALWESERARDRAVLAEVSNRASATADSLRARLDSAEAELLDDLEDEHARIIETKDAAIDRLEADRASLWSQRETLSELVVGLESEVSELRAANDALQGANRALRTAIDASRSSARKWKLGSGALAALTVVAFVR